MLEQDPSILNEVNPILIFAQNQDEMSLSSECLYLLDDDNIFAVSQV